MSSRDDIRAGWGFLSMRPLLISGFLAAAAVLLVPQARAADARGYESRTEIRTVVRERADPAQSRGYTGALPSCADPEVEGRIAHGFAQTERTYWGSDLQLTGFVRQAEIGYRPWGRSFIPRRFCTATTVTTDGRRRQVSYSIREWQSWGTLSWGVEWCVGGLDRSYAYAPDCKMARP
jgi:hypothetical protein